MQAAWKLNDLATLLQTVARVNGRREMRVDKDDRWSDALVDRFRVVLRYRCAMFSIVRVDRLLQRFSQQLLGEEKRRERDDREV